MSPRASRSSGGCSRGGWWWGWLRWVIRGGVCLRRFRLFDIEVSRLESIDRYGIIAVVIGNGEKCLSVRLRMRYRPS